jgi:hypothetical protein
MLLHGRRSLDRLLSQDAVGDPLVKLLYLLEALSLGPATQSAE